MAVIPTREMPEWIIEGMGILEEKAAFLNMACMAMGLLPVGKVEEVSTPKAWSGLARYAMEIEDELRQMKEAASGKEPMA